MKKKPAELLRLARNAMLKAGANPVMAEAAAQHLLRAEEQGLPVAEAGMVGVAFTNSPAAITPWGGKTPLFGTDPVAFAFPRASGDSLVIDLALTGSAIGPEADSFFAEQGNKPRIGHAFLAIDPGALTGHERYFERVETVVTTMLADELLAKIEKLALA